MKSKDIFDSILDTITPLEMRQTRLSMDVVERIHELLTSKGLSQKDLAVRLGKRESEVSKWLSIGHNLTLNSLAKLEIALDSLILASPIRMEKETGLPCSLTISTIHSDASIEWADCVLEISSIPNCIKDHESEADLGSPEFTSMPDELGDQDKAQKLAA